MTQRGFCMTSSLNRNQNHTLSTWRLRFASRPLVFRIGLVLKGEFCSHRQLRISGSLSVLYQSSAHPQIVDYSRVELLGGAPKLAHISRRQSWQTNLHVLFPRRYNQFAVHAPAGKLRSMRREQSRQPVGRLALVAR